MTDPGLNQRLRQRSRRAGLMIGISMALTIAVLVGGFSLIYAALDDTVGDFISRDVPAPIIPTEQTIAQTDDASDDPEVQPESTEDPDESESEASEATEEPESATTEESDAFVPDYQSSTQARLNFRMEPSSAGGESTVVTTLDEGTLLQFAGETAASDDPAVDGADGWMLFELEDGTEGWLRAIDVLEVEP